MRRRRSRDDLFPKMASTDTTDKEQKMKTMIVIDAENAILGRLASYVAKRLLNGRKVVIVNAEKALVSGKERTVHAKYKQRVDRADLANPRRSPKFPKRPDMLLRRTIRGMLPYRTRRGKKAMRNLKVYMGVPPEFGKNGMSGFESVKEAVATRSVKNYVTILELSKKLGWTGWTKC